jgi:hypothetical protein
MKTLKTFLTASVLTLLVFTSCTENDENLIDNTAQIQELVDTFISGSWRITNFNDSGQDETSDFAGYNFTFSANSSVVATNGNETVNGTWSVTDSSNSSSSSSDDDIDFNLFFSVLAAHNFDDLNDDWDVETVSATSVSLIDISGGNGGTDRLTFTKN